MTEFLKSCPIEGQISMPLTSSQSASNLYECAYAPAMTAPYEPAFGNHWQKLSPMQGAIQEIFPIGGWQELPKDGMLCRPPMGGGRLYELPINGGGWNKFPPADKLLPLPNDFPIMNQRGAPNEYIGYARSAGMQDCLGKSRAGGGYLTGISRAIEDGVPIARTLKNRK